MSSWEPQRFPLWIQEFVVLVLVAPLIIQNLLDLLHKAVQTCLSTKIIQGLKELWVDLIYTAPPQSYLTTWANSAPVIDESASNSPDKFRIPSILMSLPYKICSLDQQYSMPAVNSVSKAPSPPLNPTDRLPEYLWGWLKVKFRSIDTCWYLSLA